MKQIFKLAETSTPLLILFEQWPCHWISLSEAKASELILNNVIKTKVNIDFIYPPRNVVILKLDGI